MAGRGTRGAATRRSYPSPEDEPMATDRMSRFQIFIGTRNTRGEVLATDDAPATTLVATDSYRWLPGRQFIVHDVDARFGEDVARSMEVIGYDRARR